MSGVREDMLSMVGGLVEQARSLYQESGDVDGAIELSGRALEMATLVDAERFLSLDAPSMASFLEMSNVEGGLIAIVADALDTQAEVANGLGLFVEASARREQALAVRELVGPLHEN